MSLKDNFNQAVKELLKKDGLVGSDLSKNAKQKSDLDKFLDAPVQERTADSAPTMSASAPRAEATEAPRQAVPPMTPPPVQTTGTRATPQGGNDGTYYETEETTIISRNTIIDGNVRSFANITIEGSVKGDVEITKNANLSGKVVGDLDCNNATMIGSSMQGNIRSKGQVKMDRDSLILGDINAQYLDLNGKIKGNVEIGGKAEFKSDAIIFGNINASTITVLDGATIQGFVNTTFLQEAATNVFPDAIAVAD